MTQADDKPPKESGPAIEDPDNRRYENAAYSHPPSEGPIVLVEDTDLWDRLRKLTEETE